MDDNNNKTMKMKQFDCLICDFHSDKYEPNWLDHLLEESHQKRLKETNLHSSEVNKERSVVVFGIRGLPLKVILGYFASRNIIVAGFYFWKESPDICIVRFLSSGDAELAVTLAKENPSIHGNEIFIRSRGGMSDIEWKCLCPADNNKIQRNPPTRPPVTLFQVSRGFLTPTISPFMLKLETFMRIFRIPYKVEYISPQDWQDCNANSNNNLLPLLKIGDDTCIYSKHEIIELLSQAYDLDLNSTHNDKTISKLRKASASMAEYILDQRLFWAIALWRWIHDNGRSIPLITPDVPSGPNIAKIKEAILNSAQVNGIAWNQNAEDMMRDACSNLSYLSLALSNSPYFMGDRPGALDAEAFAILAQIYWNMPGTSLELKMKSEHPSLVSYLERMKGQFWPDWLDQLRNARSSTKLVPAPIMPIMGIGRSYRRIPARQQQQQQWRHQYHHHHQVNALGGMNSGMSGYFGGQIGPSRLRHPGIPPNLTYAPYPVVPPALVRMCHQFQTTLTSYYNCYY